MATLELEIGGSYPEQSANGGDAMIAEIVRFTSEGRPANRRSVAVLPSQVNIIDDLQPGSWEVKLLTPAGTVISCDVDIDDGRKNRVRISLTVDTASPRRRKPGTAAQAKTPKVGARRRGSFLKRYLDLGSYEETYAGSVVFQPPPAPRSFYGNVPSDHSRTGAVRRWSNLAEGVEGGLDTTEMLSATWGAPPTPTDDAKVGIWQIPAPAEHARATRVWVEIGAGNNRRIHSAPVPWTDFDWGGMVLLTTRGDGTRSMDSDISLMDQRFAGIIGYLAGGAVTTAAKLLMEADGEVLRDAGSMLRGKGQCPFGAAAAGYVLVGSSKLTKHARWHDWIGNLSSLFPWLPDGAILAARLRLLTARTEEDARAALPHLEQALIRGLPFYSVGLGWLLATMNFFEDDSFISELRPLVERVATSIDMDAPFTTLELRAPR